MEFTLSFQTRRNANGVRQFNMRVLPWFHWCITSYAERPGFKIKARVIHQFHWYKKLRVSAVKRI